MKSLAVKMDKIPQESDEIAEVMDRLILHYGRSGSGRASVLRLIGAYILFQSEGGAGLRRRGFSRDSIRLYRDKLHDAGVTIKGERNHAG
jgi:hypothetical protein